jgi:hypothetical protein
MSGFYFPPQSFTVPARGTAHRLNKSRARSHLCPAEPPSTVQWPGRLAGYAIRRYDAGLLALLHPSPAKHPYLCQSLDGDISKVSALPPRAGCPKIVAESLRRLLLPLMNFSTVQGYVMVIGDAIDSDGSEGKRFKPHMRFRRHGVLVGDHDVLKENSLRLSKSTRSGRFFSFPLQTRFLLTPAQPQLAG